MGRQKCHDIASKAINAPMDTTSPAGRAFLQIQAAFAEMERNIIRQRIKEGITAARARGRRGGRPRIMIAEKRLSTSAYVVFRTFVGINPSSGRPALRARIAS